MEKTPKAKIGKIFFGIILISNILFLDYNYFIKPKSQLTLSDKEIDTPESSPTPELINISITPFPPVQLNDIEQIIKTKTFKEIYIPIGSGSTKSSVWQALTGVEVNIDTEKYGLIKESYFQASLRIPTANGEVHAKLVNETDKHDVWFSEVVHQGSTAGLKEAKITITPGVKLYRVYLKSTLEAEAVLDLARIKLIVED